MRKLAIVFVVLCSAFLLASCTSPSPTPTPVPTAAPTNSVTPTASVTWTATVTVSLTPTPSATPTSTARPTATLTPTESSTPTATATRTETSTPLAPSPTPTLFAWEGLPVMPEIMEGFESDMSYVYSADASLGEAEDFYLVAMDDAGWELAQREENPQGDLGPTVVLTFVRGNEVAQVTCIYSQSDEYVMVVLAAFEEGGPPAAGDPDLSGLTLTVEDLPDGFVPVSLAELDLSEAELRETFEIESAFAFQIINEAYYQTIIGFATPLLADTWQSGDQARLASQVEIVAESITMGYAGPGAEIETLELPEGIGDAAEGRTFVVSFEEADLQGHGIRTEVMVFQRGAATVILIVEYVDSLEPAISTVDLAAILDQRARETLGLE